MFSLDPKTGKITKLPIQGDYAYRFNLAAHAPVLTYLSYKTMEPASAYVATIARTGTLSTLRATRFMAACICLRISMPAKSIL